MGFLNFYMHVFSWGHNLLRTISNVIVEEVISVEFVMNTIANDEGRNINLKEKLLLKYAISNLSIVENYEH